MGFGDKYVYLTPRSEISHPIFIISQLKDGSNYIKINVRVSHPELVTIRDHQSLRLQKKSSHSKYDEL